MGRIQKKKDPQKKKALKAERNNLETTPVSSGAQVLATKPVPARKPSALAKPKSGANEKNLVQKIIQFLLEVKIELKKVAWLIPAFRQTSATDVPSSVCLMMNAFCASVNFDAFIRLRSSPSQGFSRGKL